MLNLAYMNEIELLGLTAMFFVLGSFLLKGEYRIRLVNGFGAMLFVIYGVIIEAWSVWLLNIFLLIIQIVFLCRRSIKNAQEKSTSIKEQRS